MIVSPRTRPVGGSRASPSRQGAYNGQGEGSGCFWKGGLNKWWRGAIFLRIVVGEDEGIISNRDEGLFKPAYMHVHWTVYRLCSC